MFACHINAVKKIGTNRDHQNDTCSWNLAHANFPVERMQHLLQVFPRDKVTLVFAQYNFKNKKQKKN